MTACVYLCFRRSKWQCASLDIYSNFLLQNKWGNISIEWGLQQPFLERCNTIFIFKDGISLFRLFHLSLSQIVGTRDTIIVIFKGEISVSLLGCLSLNLSQIVLTSWLFSFLCLMLCIRCHKKADFKQDVQFNDLILYDTP